MTQTCHSPAVFLGESSITRKKVKPMDTIFQTSFDNLIGSLIACLILREALIPALPDRIAGPGGWLINTSAD